MTSGDWIGLLVLSKLYLVALLWLLQVEISSSNLRSQHDFDHVVGFKWKDYQDNLL